MSRPPLFDLTGWMLGVLRRILYLGTRTQVFPESPEALGLKPDLPVCYVLDERHLSNLLVLDHECGQLGLPRALHPMRDEAYTSQRSFFFLSHNERGRLVPNPRVSAAPMLKAMVRAAFTDTRFDVQLVPVTILWGREPGKQESVLKALLAESWQQVSTLRHLLAMLIHGRHTMLRFNAPISLREFLSDGIDEAHAVRKLGRILRVHFRRQREMAIGPDLSHRHTQLQTLLNTPSVHKAIAAEAEARSISLVAAKKTAREFAIEIASDYSYAVVKAFALFLTWVWNKIYNGIEVHNFERVTNVAPGHGIIYVPCHRSHADYLLLSYIIFNRGLMVPHIAAGANLNLPLVGSILRRSGAFFLRRKIKGEPLYATVFQEYVHLMIERGFPMEYFIEGGRSRGGRTLAPKAGILAMTVQSFVRSHARPLVFVPVYVGYEKLMEGNSYLAELHGRPKKSESLFDLVRAARLLKQNFGKVHVNFGPPLALAEFLDAQQPDWRELPFDAQAPWLRGAVDATAMELARRINSLAVVNPVNLVAATLLSTPKHAADLRLLQKQIGHCQHLLAQTSWAGTIVRCDLPPDEVIAYVRRLDLVQCHPHPLGDMIRADEQQAALLAYFRNNILHLLALPALLACLVSHNRQLSRQRAREAIRGIYGLLRAELFLPWPTEELDAVIDLTESALAQRGLIQDGDGDSLRAPPPNSEASPQLQQLGEILRPTLERQFLTLALLQHYGSGQLTRARLEEDAHLLAQRLAMLYEFNSAEFSEKLLFANVVRNLIDGGILQVDDGGLLRFDARITLAAAQTELLLAADVRHSIHLIARAAPSPAS
ncbi:glycerol-3-phosphate 1-O-acyltransferase PlsB [Sulfuritalea sp.]|uniref:glycerol-3-phosphate 1-O-acyltransferase PlsB n=1 Tax=Sulfuritalea sp. TaxID=2480090 RepID=UPI001AC80A24|nr:glycerol-3-phosphate 1-O-acyltransferase PlsB [Sulfuritalea sp.]MBN8476796.1 glycerol-3-phosphate 1-O-acyltransferase PlsB [Sulfuritalea sp.]